MTNHPKKDTIWQYCGPQLSGVPHGQLHKVVMSNTQEIVTIGIPYGTGATFLGDPKTFREQFSFKYDQL